MPAWSKFAVVGVVTVCATLASPCAPPAAADEPIPHGQSQPPGPALSPAEAIKKMTVPPGFSVEVVASEPDIVNPVAMTFDERGRVWITESLEYPRREPGPGRDRIKILEDTDGDGRADKFTVFAEGLNIPSGIAVGHGGVWVANSPDILFLKDTNGDDKADTREVVVSGFGRFDTHELPNSMIWGPDGWLYGWNGVFNQSKINYRGRQYDFTCAIFRINPETRQFEVFCEGTSNPWGIAIDQEGSFFASACVIDHLWHLVETGYYLRQGGPYPPFTWKIDSIVEHKHQKAAYCGIHYFDSDAYPPQYRDRLFMGNIHGNCVNVDRVERNGSSYKGLADHDFLSANDAWFMPVVQKTGPDGCLYILDWYDRYHCYQDANRDPAGIDRLKGRLYRVRYKDTPRAAKFDLAKELDGQLMGRLRSPNVFYRDLAQRVLTERLSANIKRAGVADDPNRPHAERGTKPALEEMVLDEHENRKARMHALWSLVGSGRLDRSFHKKLLASHDATLRAWATRAAGNMHQVDPQISEAVGKLATDSSPDVRLQAVIAAGKVEGLDPLPVYVAALSANGDDALIPHIVWQNLHPKLEDRGAEFLALLSKRDLKGEPALASLMPRIAERILARNQSDPAPIVELVQLLTTGKNADPKAAGRVLIDLADKIQNSEIDGERLNQLRAKLQPALAPLLAADNALGQDAAILAASWDNSLALDRVQKLLAEGSLPEALRIEAIDALIAGERGTKALEHVTAALKSRSGRARPEQLGHMLAALSRLDDPRVGPAVLAAYPTLEPELKPRAIELLTHRASWSKALLDAIAQKKVPSEALNVNQVRALLQSDDKDLVARVRKEWGTVREGRDAKREQVVKAMRAFLAKTPGDPFAGQKAFQKICAQCHKIYGEGQDVGPDLTGNGRNDYDQLVSNVFDPSLVIGAAYQATTVATTEGRVLTGLLAEDSPQRVVLKTQGGKLETISRDDIDEMKTSQLSLMPEDVEKQLTPQEVADLFAFLCLDKPPTDPSAKRLPGSPAPRRRASAP